MGVKAVALAALLLALMLHTAFAATIIIRPSSAGAYVPNSALEPEKSYDNNLATYATLNTPANRTLDVRSATQSDLGVITAVKIEGVIGTAAAGSGAGYDMRWMRSASLIGSSHTFSGVKGVDVNVSYDVTGERSWSWGDFGVVELVVNHTSGSSSGYAREVWFNVTYLQGTSLAIWDQTDAQGGGQTKYPGEEAKFFANYTNLTGAAVAGASCNITFSVGGGGAMSYNATSALYEYNRSFASAGISTWSVTCGKSDYVPRAATNSVVITSSGARWVSTDKAAYVNCGYVYYKVTASGESGNVDTNMTIKVIDPLSVVRSQFAAVTGNGGTGIYLGSYVLQPGSALGSWNIRAITCGSVGNQPFTVSS